MTEERERRVTGEGETKWKRYGKFLKNPPLHFVLPGWWALAPLIIGAIMILYPPYKASLEESYELLRRLPVMYIIYGLWAALCGFGLARGTIPRAEDTGDRKKSYSWSGERDTKGKRYWNYLKNPPRLRFVLSGWWTVGLIGVGVVMIYFPPLPDPREGFRLWRRFFTIYVIYSSWNGLCGLGLAKGFFHSFSGPDDIRSHWLLRLLNYPLFGGAENTDPDDNCS